MAYILSLDQGTTSSRAMVFGDDGAIHGVAQKELPQNYPQPGWVEHDPEEIWATQLGVAAEALARAGLAPRDVAAIGITNQRETTIVWERNTGRPSVIGGTTDIPVESLRLKLIRDALVDMEYALRLQAQGDSAFLATNVGQVVQDIYT